MKKLLLVISAFLGLVVTHTTAAPGLLQDSLFSLQYRITNASGNPVSGTITATYRYYLDSVGGTALGTGYDTVVANTEGLVVTRSKGFPPLPPGPLPIIHDQVARFIEIEFPGIALGMAEGSSVVLPRIRLTPAIHSLSSRELRGGAVTTGKRGLAAFWEEISTPAVEIKMDSSLSMTSADIITRNWSDTSQSVRIHAGPDSTYMVVCGGGDARTFVQPGRIVVGDFWSSSTRSLFGTDTIMLSQSVWPKAKMLLTPSGLVFQDSSGLQTGFVPSDFNFTGSSCWQCPAGNYTYLSSINDSVGIGTNTPSEKLRVSGPARFGNGERDPWLLARKGLIVASNTAGSWGRSNNDTTGIYLPSNTSDYSVIYGKTDASATKMVFAVGDDSQDHIIMQPSGSVGINTETPTAKLDVDVSGTTGLRAAEFRSNYSSTGGVGVNAATVTTQNTNLNGISLYSYASTLDATAVITNDSSSGEVLKCFGGGYAVVFEVGADGRTGVNTDNANSRLHVNGSLATAITSTGSDLTLGESHHIVFGTSTLAPRTITLPTAVGINGREYTIKRTGTQSVTVATTSGQTIDGAAGYLLSAQYRYVTVVSNGSNWLVIGNN